MDSNDLLLMLNALKTGNVSTDVIGSVVVGIIENVVAHQEDCPPHCSCCDYYDMYDR